MRYHFDEAIGDQRIPQCDTFEGDSDATRYGLDEFMRVARHPTVNAEVSLVSPWVDGSPQEAAALVAYANADPGSAAVIGVDGNGKDWQTAGYWGRLREANRKAHGESGPYCVKFLEVGNEQYLAHGTPPRESCGRPRRFFPNERWVKGIPIATTALDHAQQVKATYNLIRTFDTKIKIGASAFTPDIMPGMPDLYGDDAATAYSDQDSDTRDPWNARLLRDAGASFDFFILHPYDLRHPVFPADPLELANRLRKTVTQLRELDRQLRPGQPPKDIAVTEFGYLFFAGRLLGALLAAHIVRVSLEEGLLMTLRHILIEDRRSPFNMSEPFANSGAILPPDYTRMPGYWAMKLLAEHLSGWTVRARGDSGVPGLSTFATYDPGNRRAAVVLIREQPHGHTWQVEVTLPPGNWQVTARELYGWALTATDEDVHQGDVDVQPAGRVVRLPVRPHSLVVLHVEG
jgi:hypothetical protein